MCTGYDKLVEYMESHDGDTKVNYFYKTENGYLLGKWVSRQRERNLSGIMPESEKNALDQINFVWRLDHREAQAKNTQNSFDNFYQHLVEYKKQTGKCDAAQTYVCEDGYRLGAAINKKRVRPERLTEEQRKKLDDIGFVWLSGRRRKY